jgi:hypothetical protein
VLEHLRATVSLDGDIDVHALDFDVVSRRPAGDGDQKNEAGTRFHETTEIHYP